MNRKVLSAALAAALLGLAGAPALAAKEAKAAKTARSAADKPTIVPVAPPSGTWEATPPPAEGWLWSAGYHAWRDGRFVWQPGEWIALKPGHEYRQHRWVQVDDKHWKLTGGDWVKADDDGKVAGKK
jgi:hypothetical protein